MSTDSNTPVSIFWFRRDLRLHDNAGLYHALKSGYPVVPIFIFDRHILDPLVDRKDRRVTFIHQTLTTLALELKQLESGITCYYSTPLEAFTVITHRCNVAQVYTNHDYEPYALKRDKEIGDFLSSRGIGFHTFKDQVIFEKDEVMSGAGTFYSVFTPYSRKWKEKLNPFYLKPYPTEKFFSHFFRHLNSTIPALGEMNFEPLDDYIPPPTVSDSLLKHYQERRNFPAIQGTSHLSVHLRFGTVSIRALATKALPLSETWLNELIWRDFYMNILWHVPRVGEGKSFRKAYDQIKWRNHPEEFQRWCQGKTGYPIVDAGMRELNTTGFMHNRVRMIVASFLVKHLLIDWRWGEAYFAEKLIDFDLAANNGGWQWASGSGCDAAPYFRVFNPTLQTEKFDKQWEYIKKWVPEYNDLAYLQNPIVDHEFARKRVLETYKMALGE